MPRKDQHGDRIGGNSRNVREVVDERKRLRGRNRGKVDAADWGNASPDALSAVVVAVTEHGFAVRFGYTRDGGAFAVGVIGDGDPYTEFIRPTEDIDAFLTELADDYTIKPDSLTD